MCAPTKRSVKLKVDVRHDTRQLLYMFVWCPRIALHVSTKTDVTKSSVYADLVPVSLRRHNCVIYASWLHNNVNTPLSLTPPIQADILLEQTTKWAELTAASLAIGALCHAPPAGQVYTLRAKKERNKECLSLETDCI